MKIRQGIVSALVALALPLTLGVFPLSASAEEIGSTASPTQSAQGDANTGNTADAPTAGDGDSADQNNSAADFEGNDVGTDAGNGETSASDAPGSAPNASDATDAADSQDSADVADSADAAEAANSADANSSGSSNKAKANADAQPAADSGDKHPNIVYKPFRQWLLDSPKSQYTDENGNAYTYSTLGMILSNYNVFTPGDLRSTHIVGPVAVGGFATGFGQFASSAKAQDFDAFQRCMQHLESEGKNGVTDVQDCLVDPNAEGAPSNTTYKNYSETNLPLGNGGVWNVPSFVNGPLVETTEERWPDQLGGISGVTYSNKDTVPFYAGETNQTDPFLALKYLEDADSYEIFGNGKIVFDDNWLDFDSVMNEIKEESQAMADEAGQVQVRVEQCNENGNTLCLRSSDETKVKVDSNIGNMKIVIAPGAHVTIKDDANFEAYRELLSKNNRPFNVRIVKDPNSELVNMPDTIINFVGEGGSSDARLPGVIFVDRFDVDAQMVQGIGTDEQAPGIPIIFNFPNVTGTIDFDPDGVRSGTQYGHVVAPNADINMFCTSGNFNGRYIAKNIAVNGEGHMWPYSGRLLASVPDSTDIHANKQLLYGTLNGGDFTFTLQLTGDSLSKPEEKQNDKDGNVDFSFEFNDGNWSKGTDVAGEDNTKDFSFTLKEKIDSASCGTDVGKVTCDNSEFKVTVRVQKTETNAGNTTTAEYKVLSTTYARVKDSAGNAVDADAQKPTTSTPLFTNVRNRELKTSTQFGFDKYVDSEKLSSAADNTTFEFALRPAKAVGTKDDFTVDTPMPKAADCARTTKLAVPLYGSDGKPVTEGEGDAAKQVTVQVDACVVKNGALKSQEQGGVQHNIWFPSIEYTRTGRYDYIVTEIPGDDADMTYDSLEHSISVTVTENSNGDLSATSTIFDQSHINFRNYNKAHTDLHFTKYVDHALLGDADDTSYVFDLFAAQKTADGKLVKAKDDDGKDKEAVCTVRNLGSAVDFSAGKCGDALTYENEGDYYYIATERTGGDPYLWYDQLEDGTNAKIEHYVHVAVTKENEKYKVSTVTYAMSTACSAGEDGTVPESCPAEAKIFNNNHKPVPFEIRKAVKELNGTAPADAEFTFKVTFFARNSNSVPLYEQGTELAYTVTTAAQGGEEPVVETKSAIVAEDGSVTFAITAAQTARFTQIPYETVFEIEELVDNLPIGFTGVSMVSSNGYTGKNKTAEQTVNGKTTQVTVPAITRDQWAKVAYGTVVTVTATNEYAVYRLPMSGGAGANINLLALGVAVVCAGLFLSVRFAKESRA